MPEEGKPRWFQFSLASMFIVMALVAISYALPQLVVPAHLAQRLGDLPEYHGASHDLHVRIGLLRYEQFLTVGLTGVLFVASCGAWYAIAHRKQPREVAIGCAFALPMGMVLLPEAGFVVAIPLAMVVGGLAMGGMGFDIAEIRLSLVGGLLYGGWPVFLKRYWSAAALCLFYGACMWLSIYYVEGWERFFSY